MEVSNDFQDVLERAGRRQLVPRNLIICCRSAPCRGSTEESNARDRLIHHCHNHGARWYRGVVRLNSFAVKDEPPQIDPLSLEANAKNLPSQEELNLKLWPQDAVAH